MSVFNTSGAFSYPSFYKKAQDIFTLSKYIGTYVADDLMLLQEDGTEDQYVYVSGDMIQQSELLGFEILKAQKQHSKSLKRMHDTRLSRMVYLLITNCSRLEKCRSNGKDYLPILKHELQNFKQMQQRWMCHL